MSQLISHINEFEVLDVLGEGGMGSVYRVKHPDEEECLALKLLHPTAHESHLEVLRFKREFKLVARLKHLSLVKVYQMGEFSGRHFFTMELVEGRGLDKAFQKPPSLEQIGSLGTQVLEALAYIHEAGVVHRDLKPENLILQNDGRVRLLDFGLHHETTAVRLTRSDMILGTIGYMSPEQVTQQSLDRRSDLYSFAVIMYELATGGHYPHPGNDATTRFHHLVMGTPPIPLSELAPDLPVELAAVIDRLLCNEPGDRFPSAGLALDAWNEALQLNDNHKSLVWEFGADSLFRPGLFGREKSMERLVEVVSQLNSRRSTFLMLSGSSGLGKTRLLKELDLYLRGRHVPCYWGLAHRHRSSPYGLWRDILKAALENGLPSELRAFLPAIEALVGSTTEHSKGEELQRAQLLFGATRLLEVYSASTGLVVLLEDLQWADPSSLELLEHLLQRRTVNITVVASWNNDERELDRRWELFECHPLEPLSCEQVGLMARSMLGGKLSYGVAEVLHKESKGNPLFVSEIVTSLVQRKLLTSDKSLWSLEQDPEDEDWPTDLVSAIQSRLSRLTKSEVFVLEAAAVLGVEFEFATLSAILLLEEEELLECLLGLVAQQVLEEAKDYIFSHHRLKDAILEKADSARIQQLNRKAAEVLESKVGTAPYILAHHYYKSGEPERGAIHLLRAGQAASLSFAYEEAVRHYESLLKMGSQRIDRRRLLEPLADAHLGAGRPKVALDFYQQALESAQGTLLRARLYRKLGCCLHSGGDYEEARLQLRIALSELKPSYWSLWSGGNEEVAQEVRILVHETLAVNYFRRGENWQFETLEGLLLDLAAAKHASLKAISPRIMFLLGFMLLNAPGAFSSLRLVLFRKASTGTLEGVEENEQAKLLRQIGYGLHLGGQPDKALESVERSIKISEMRADQRGLSEAHLIACTLLHYLGRLEEARRHGEKALELAEKCGERRVEMTVHSDLIHMALLRGDLQQAQENYDAMCRHPAAQSSPFAAMICDLVLTWSKQTKGEFASALELARTNQARCLRLKSERFYYSVLQCQELVALLSLAAQASQSEEYLAQTLQCLKGFATGGHWLFQGRKNYFWGLYWTSTKESSKARTFLEKASSIFEGVDSPLELARVELAFSKIEVGEESQRRELRARDLFAKSGACLEDNFLGLQQI